MLAASSPLTPTEYGLNTNSIHVVVVPVAIIGVLPAAPAPTFFAPMVQLQQLYDDSEFYRPSSSQHITGMLPVHRPMPWPSFMSVHAYRDQADRRPLPWLSFKEVIGEHGERSASIDGNSIKCHSLFSGVRPQQNGQYPQ